MTDFDDTDDDDTDDDTDDDDTDDDDTDDDTDDRDTIDVFIPASSNIFFISCRCLSDDDCLYIPTCIV